MEIFISVKICEKIYLICLKLILFWGLLMLIYKVFIILVYSFILVGLDLLNYLYLGLFVLFFFIFIGNEKL